MIGIKCARRNNFNTNHFRKALISGLFYADSDVHFAAVYLPPKVGGGLVFADGLDDPILVLHEAALGQ